METVSPKQKLLDAMQACYEDEQRFMAGLSEAERSEPGTWEIWSARDILAHITYWMEHSQVILDAALHGQTPPDSADFEVANREVFDARNGMTWDEVRAGLEQAYADVVGLVEQLSEEDLLNPDRYPWRNGQALARAVTGNGYWHPYSHLVDYQIKRGHMKEAAAIQERLVVSAEKMDPRVDDKLATFYNLACFYAMAGEREKALTCLGRVLPRSAELREWSMKDPDLTSLHGVAAFKALLEPGEE